MDNRQPATSPEHDDSAPTDLARRLTRLRRRIAAEDRPRSVRLIERAIEEAAKKD
jgi:hypothetical protein